MQVGGFQIYQAPVTAAGRAHQQQLPEPTQPLTQDQLLDSLQDVYAHWEPINPQPTAVDLPRLLPRPQQVARDQQHLYDLVVSNISYYQRARQRNNELLNMINPEHPDYERVQRYIHQIEDELHNLYTVHAQLRVQAQQQSRHVQQTTVRRPGTIDQYFLPQVHRHQH